MNLSELDDIALIRQIQHGDESAMEEFYHRFAPGLHSFIRRKLNSPEDIEDILAETITSTVTAIMRFKGESRVFTWLCRIADYKLADHYRRRGSEATLPLDEGLANPNSTEKDLETDLMVWQTLAKLNRDYRRVLEAKYFSGFSVREIAFQLSKSEKSVESILTRARQAFAREYSRLAPETEYSGTLGGIG